MNEDRLVGAAMLVLAIVIFLYGFYVGHTPQFMNGSASCIEINYQMYCKADKVVP
jgi:hypothetical protein